jgi:hypothetical protein
VNKSLICKFLSARWIVVSLLCLAFCASKVPAQDAPAHPVPAAGEKARHPAPPHSSFHEDFTSLSIATSHFVPEQPVMSFKDDKPSFTREIWQVAWRPADPIDLFVIRPKNVPKPPVILFLYSFPANAQKFKDDTWCLGVTNSGYAAIGFVSALTGERVEYQPLNENFLNQLPTALVETAHDVPMILDFLSKRDDLDLSHVGMFGEGSGATIAILAASAEPRIKAVEALDAWGDWSDWLAGSTVVPKEERANYLKPDFLDRLKAFDPVDFLPRLNSRSVLIQNLRPNTRVPEVCQKRLEAAAPDTARIDQFEDGRGFLTSMITGGLIFRWLKDQLKPDAPPVRALAASERVHYYPASPGNPSSPPSPSPQEPH